MEEKDKTPILKELNLPGEACLYECSKYLLSTYSGTGTEEAIPNVVGEDRETQGGFLEEEAWGLSPEDGGAEA